MRYLMYIRLSSITLINKIKMIYQKKKIYLLKKKNKKKTNINISKVFPTILNHEQLTKRLLIMNC